MATFTAWIMTDKVGSECRQEFDVPDDEIEGLTERERVDLISGYARDAVFEMCEWGWDEGGSES